MFGEALSKRLVYNPGSAPNGTQICQACQLDYFPALSAIKVDRGLSRFNLHR
jgi:hypothetical protein